MNKHTRKIYIILVAFAVVVIGTITTREILRPRHEVVGFFVDSNSNAYIYFSFIKVNKYDKQYLTEVSRGLMEQYSSANANSDSMMTIIVAHFYNLDDTAAPDEKMAARLRKLYPERKDLINKLNYIENGYIYTGFSRNIHGMKLPADTLLQGPIFVPKPGVKAKDVLRRKKYFLSGDKKKVNFPDSTNGIIE